jgi:N-acyl-D-amino-acid deacylase
MHDIVILGGTIVDGTGAPPRQGNVGVDGDTISVISTEVLSGRQIIDATGLIIAPGFIDLHSHADFTLADNPEAITQLAQGVTTLVGGNCGKSPFPLTERNRNEPSFVGTAPSADVAWTDFSGYADAVSATKPGVNLAMQVGHGQVRSAVLGSEDRAPSDRELDEMLIHVRTAADQGVFGMSSGLIYPPGRFAARDEMVHLVTEAARHGLLYSTHIRNETDQIVTAVDEALDTAAAAGARLEISHLKSMGPSNVGLSRTALAHIDAATLRGVDATCDVYPYTASSTSLASRLPSWALDGGSAELAVRLADPHTRARIIDDLDERFGRDIDPAGIVLAEVGAGKFHDQAGKSIVEIGTEIGLEPAAVVLDVLAAHGDVVIVNHAIDEDDMRTVLASANTSVASDGWILTADGPGHPHPRSFGTFARVLGKYVREEHVLSLEDAVRKMTTLPAERVGIVDRARIAPGFRADIVVFNQETIADRSTYADPWQLAEGVHTVLVNGQVAWVDGTATTSRAGRVLRRE